MNSNLDYLIKEIIIEDPKMSGIIIPKEISKKKKLYEILRTMRKPAKLSDEYLKLQDEFLQMELKELNITDINNFNKKSIIEPWQGDITLLNTDVIINFATEYMLGCFIPNHNCPDNRIHLRSGMELRRDCYQETEGHILPIGEARITKGYNLPAKYVIHVIGPQVLTEVHDIHRELLTEGINNSLDLASNNKLSTVAFSSISYDEYNIDLETSYKIIYEAVKNYLKKHKKAFKKVIINANNEKEYEILTKIIKMC
jgi:O-acetyl-ADP-ribose deacetylase (regulator of RNase III)